MKLFEEVTKLYFQITFDQTMFSLRGHRFKHNFQNFIYPFRFCN